MSATKTKTIKNIDIDILHAFDKYKATLPDGTNDAEAFTALIKLTEQKPADTTELEKKITELQTQVNELTIDAKLANDKVADYENLKNNALAVGEENHRYQLQINAFSEKITELEAQIQPPAPELTPDDHLMEVITNPTTINMMRKVRPFYKKKNEGLNDNNWASHLVDKALKCYMKYEFEDIF